MNERGVALVQVIKNRLFLIGKRGMSDGGCLTVLLQLLVWLFSLDPSVICPTDYAQIKVRRTQKLGQFSVKGYFVCTELRSIVGVSFLKLVAGGQVKREEKTRSECLW